MNHLLEYRVSALLVLLAIMLHCGRNTILEIVTSHSTREPNTFTTFEFTTTHVTQNYILQLRNGFTIDRGQLRAILKSIHVTQDTHHLHVSTHSATIILRV